MTQEPPLVLVRTWIDLLSSEDEGVRNRAATMLLNNFGNFKAVEEYAKKHNIDFR